MWLGCQLPTVQGRHSRVTVGGHGIQSAIPELSEEQSTQVTLARHSGVEVRLLYQGVGGGGAAAFPGSLQVAHWSSLQPFQGLSRARVSSATGQQSVFDW